MKRYRPQLDSLRAFAAIAILFAHFWIGGSTLATPVGLLAVRLFFVLSGFLLTSILLAERDEASRRGIARERLLRNFYARRILRIWPAYYLAIGAALLFGAAGVAATFAWHALFGSNILYFLEGAWDPVLLSHLWTLAIEEQFYLVLPLVVLFLPRSLLRPVLVGGIAAALLFRFIVAALFDGPHVFYSALPLAQLDALCGGALLAEILAGGRTVKWKPLLAWSLPAALVLNLLPLPEIINYPLVPAAYVIAMIAAVAAAQQGVGGMAGAVLGNRALIAMGRISYGVYLYHVLVWGAANAVQRSLGYEPLHYGFVSFVIWSSLSIAVATASWFLVERPALSLRRRFQLDRPAPTLIPAAPTSA